MSCNIITPVEKKNLSTSCFGNVKASKKRILSSWRSKGFCSCFIFFILCREITKGMQYHEVFQRSPEFTAVRGY